MARLAVGRENSTDIEIHYDDHGRAQPVVLIHGYPLNGTHPEQVDATLLDFLAE